MQLPFFKKHKKEPARIATPARHADASHAGWQSVAGGEKKTEKVDKVEAPKRKRGKKTGRAFGILKSFHVTEKATDLSKNDQYVFEVFPKANKPEIKKAIEEIFDVDVISVNIVKTPSKRRRLGRTFGWRKGHKKAIVKIKKGQKIDILPK